MARLFGTNGIRGVVGREITAEFALRLGRALGGFFGGGTVAVGTDTRTTADLLREALVAGLTAGSCDALLLGVTPTPALQLFVARRGLRGGVAVTASHNPAEYNGFKVIGGDGMDLSRVDEERIESSVAAGNFPEIAWDRCGRIHQDPGSNAFYVDAILALSDTAAIARRKPMLVLDCASGAAVHTSPEILRRLGCSVTSLNGQPDGTFPGRPPEPREEHLSELRRTVLDAKADLGIAHDGDADRAVFIDDRGRLVHGDRALAVVARERLRGKPGTVVTPVTSSSCVADVVRENGGEVEYTAVGSPVVSRRMKEVGAVLGGEESGGLMFPELHCAKDGGMAAARMVELLAVTGKKLSDLVDALPAYSLARRSVSVPAGSQAKVVAGIRAAVAGEKVLTVDGFRIERPEGWVVVRPSGTEPLFRIYAEARTPGEAASLAAYAEGLVRSALR